MRMTRINWPLVRFKMEERGVTGWAALARVANVHRNTLSRKGPFASTTIDHLAHYFDCDPRELITVEDAPDAAPAPATTTAARRPKPRGILPDTSQVPADKAQAEAERRAALLAQAAGRQKP